MKKVLFFIILVFLNALFLHAQEFKIGGKVGANVTGLTGIQFDQGFNFGYHAGGFAEIMLSKKWGIQPEVLWS